MKLALIIAAVVILIMLAGKKIFLFVLEKLLDAFEYYYNEHR